MNAIFAIARYTFIEQIRNRLYLIIIFFGFIMLSASWLLGELAPGHSVRVLYDVGFLILECFGLVAAVFGAVTLVLQEIESKTIYLLVTRPLARPNYIIGRFLGLVVAVALAMVAMACLHVTLMLMQPRWFKVFTEGWNFWAVYPVVLTLSVLKMIITAAVAIFFSMFATSPVSALVFTVFFWVAGHFGQELSFMIDRATTGLTQKLVHGVAALLPNYQYLNLKDTFSMAQFSGFEVMGAALLYSLGYTAVCLIGTSILFSRKEF